MRMTVLRRTFAVIALLSGLRLLAQSPSPAASPPPAQPVNVMTTSAGNGGDGGAIFDMKRLLTRFEFWLTLLVVLFGAIVVALQFLLLRGHRTTGDDILKVFGVTLIVVGSLVLITAGFSDKQIAPAMGLFGTISGYLLGRASAKTNTDSRSSEGDNV